MEVEVERRRPCSCEEDREIKFKSDVRVTLD